jgi:hypothetical protein
MHYFVRSFLAHHHQERKGGQEQKGKQNTPLLSPLKAHPISQSIPSSFSFPRSKILPSSNQISTRTFPSHEFSTSKISHPVTLVCLKYIETG